MKLNKLIVEQFNISNMDFGKKPKRNNNIFNKEIFNANDIYDKILNKKNVVDAEIEYLDDKVSCVSVKTTNNLKNVVLWYSVHYNTRSLNWLNVSDITYMNSVFLNTKYNGDISKWDVSSVTDMTSMFYNSKFNNDISDWDVSNVTDMTEMFAFSKFN